MKIVFDRWSMKIMLAFIFIALTVLCASIMAQEYTADYWLQKGDEFNKNSSYDLALRCYEKAIEINPRDANAWHNKGNILKELGRTKEADASFAKANEGDISNVDVSSSSKMPSPSLGNIDYVVLEPYEQGDGSVMRIMLHDFNDNYLAENGIAEIDFYCDKEDTESVYSKTFYVNSSDFEQFQYRILGKNSPFITAWVSDRIPYDILPECDDGHLSGWHYVRATFIESDGTTHKSGIEYVLE